MFWSEWKVNFPNFVIFFYIFEVGSLKSLIIVWEMANLGEMRRRCAMSWNGFNTDFDSCAFFIFWDMVILYVRKAYLTQQKKMLTLFPIIFSLLFLKKKFPYFLRIIWNLGKNSSKPNFYFAPILISIFLQWKGNSTKENSTYGKYHLRKFHLRKILPVDISAISRKQKVWK